MTPLLPGFAAAGRATLVPARSRRGSVVPIISARRRRVTVGGLERAGFDEVLQAAQCGFGPALERLYLAYIVDVAAYARGHGAPDPAAVANSTLLGVLRRIGRFRGDQARFEVWIYTVARNALAAERRPKARAGRRGEVGRRDAARLLGGLPARLRDVVLLRGVADLTTEQIAEVVGVSVRKAWVLRRRAALALLHVLDERPPAGGTSDLATVQQRVSAAGLIGEVPRPTPELLSLFGPARPAADEGVEVADDGGGFARRVASLGAATVTMALVSLTVGGPLGVLPVSTVSAAVVAQADAPIVPSSPLR